jgi:hypothetical protein
VRASKMNVVCACSPAKIQLTDIFTNVYAKKSHIFFVCARCTPQFPLNIKRKGQHNFFYEYSQKQFFLNLNCHPLHTIVEKNSRFSPQINNETNKKK